VCCQRCDRCEGPLQRCVQLVDTGHSPITLCFVCWSDLTLRVAEIVVTEMVERRSKR
jgi:hypothetical protein